MTKIPAPLVLCVALAVFLSACPGCARPAQALDRAAVVRLVERYNHWSDAGLPMFDPETHEILPYPIRQFHELLLVLTPDCEVTTVSDSGKHTETAWEFTKGQGALRFSFDVSETITAGPTITISGATASVRMTKQQVDEDGKTVDFTEELTVIRHEDALAISRVSRQRF